jgi:polysaccharide pyruvyl transferase WcaK-like protein
MPTIEIPAPAASAVYETLGGKRTALSPILEQTRELLRTGHDVTWRVPVTASVVHRLEGLFRLGVDEGAGFELGTIGALSTREQAFLDDFGKYCLGQCLDDTSEISRGAELAGELAEEAVSLAVSIAPLLAGQRLPAPTSLDRVVIIGAYGGDHVGDAAILGGVLLGLNARYGVTHAHVLSHRPQHTRRLAAGLVTPVQVTVSHYNVPAASSYVQDSDAVVVAGGPMMDLPRVLAKHIATAAAAKRYLKPLIVERIGIGPFKRRSSEAAARLLLRNASRISTRTSKAAKHRVARGLQVDVGRDPAFDYLETRRDLTLMTPDERSSAEGVLQGTDGRLVVGLNVRPIRHDWSPRGSAFAQEAETRFIAEVASAIGRFSERATRPVTVIYYAMNPIQFGMSDLESAYRIRRALGGSVDFRVWEADPDVDALLLVLRRFDVCVAMRFHGCIFALSQGLKVIGIDYYPGQAGKVEQLFQDLGRGDDVRVMDEVTGDWLLERFEHHTAGS